jgi:hypothetical protein
MHSLGQPIETSYHKRIMLSRACRRVPEKTGETFLVSGGHALTIPASGLFQPNALDTDPCSVGAGWLLGLAHCPTCV